MHLTPKWLPGLIFGLLYLLPVSSNCLADKDFYIVAELRARLVEYTVHSLEPQIHLYCNYIRTHFNTVLLHRILMTTNQGPTAVFTTAINKTCETALATLKQAVRIARSEAFYYLWDNAHLMIAKTAMILAKILKYDLGAHVTCAIEAVAVLEELSGVCNIAAAAITRTGRELPENDVILSSSIETQQQLLKTILLELEVDVILLNPHRSPNNGHGNEQATSRVRGISTVGCPVPIAGEFVKSRPDSTVFMRKGVTQQNSVLQFLSSQDLLTAMSSIDEMCYLLSNDSIESWFAEAGLLLWNEQSIFRNYV